jgi:hypothetical protein
VLVSRYVDMPKEATGGALCHACIEPGEPVLDRLVENFQRTIMRDLRVLPTPGPPGSA